MHEVRPRVIDILQLMIELQYVLEHILHRANRMCIRSAATFLDDSPLRRNQLVQQHVVVLEPIIQFLVVRRIGDMHGGDQIDLHRMHSC